MLLVWLMLVIAAGASLVALLTLLRNPTSPKHRWLFILILAACAWVVSVNLHSIVDPSLGIWLLRFAFICASILTLAVARFSQAITGVVDGVATKIAFPLLVVVNSVLSLSPWVIVSITVRNGGDVVEPVRGIGYPIVVGIILYLLLHGLILLEHHRRLQKGLRRSQLAIVEVGLASGALVGIITNVVLPNLAKTTFPSRFAFISIVILTVSLVYTVVQQRFLDIRFTAARAVAYAATLLIVASLYGGIIIAITRFTLTDVAVDSPLRQLVFTVVIIFAAITFHPLKKFFDRTTSKLFFRDAYDVKEVLDSVSDAFVEELNTTALIDRAGTILMRAVKAKHVEGVLAGKRKVAGITNNERMLVGRNANDPTGLVKHLPGIAQKVIVADELDDQDSLHEELIDANVAVCVRLETSKELLGYLLVGYKANGAPYTHQDIELIRIAADELAVAVQNALRFDEIEHFNSTLKQQVADATAELRESNRQLKELDIVKDEFISMASHQLRTPLTSIKGYISMLLDGDAGKVSAEQHKFLEEAFISSQRMVYLVGDFLNVSRIQTGKFVLETRPTNLAEVVADEVERLQMTAGHRGVTIEFNKPANFPILTIDEEKTRQVIMNFIDNAVFYSRPNGQIKIELAAQPHQVRFTVTDRGIGVPESEKSKLFTKFFRATNARRIRPDGTGVGLFLAKKVVNIQGGQVIGETKENVGSTFGFSLPIKSKDTATMNPLVI